MARLDPGCRCGGLTDFYGLQALACRGMLEGGEGADPSAGRRKEDGLAVALQFTGCWNPSICR